MKTFTKIITAVLILFTSFSGFAQSTVDSTKNEVDKALDTYEKFGGQYFKLQKRMQEGDTSAQADMEKLSLEVSSAAEILTKNSTKLSPQQTQRLQDIGKKLAEIAQAYYSQSVNSQPAEEERLSWLNSLWSKVNHMPPFAIFFPGEMLFLKIMENFR